MLQVRNANITYKKDLRVLVDGLSFVLNEGDKAAVIGEEGNGKSTLLKWIYDEKLVEEYAECSGEIIRNRHMLGYLKQELSQTEKKETVYEFLSEEPGFWETDTKELAKMAGELKLHFELFYSEQRVDTLSGGEKVKLQLVRILCRRPDVLLLDEPSNDIDLETLEWLETFISEWRGAVLFISHDETLLENTANMIIHLEQIKKKREARHSVWRTGYTEYCKGRADNFHRQEQLAKKERSEYQKQQEKLRRIEQKVEHQQEIITRQDPHGAALLKKKMRAVKSLEHRLDRQFAQMTEIPDTEEAIFFAFKESEGIPNGKTVLNLELPVLSVAGRILSRGIHLQIKGPEKVCIVGKNGVGKTTLLKLIADELLERKDIQASYMPQNYEELLDLDCNPVEYLAETGNKEELTRIRTYLGSMKYTFDEMSHPIRELSGGQKAKIFLLKMSMNGSNVLILDEPTRNFSPLSNPVIRKLLQEYKGTIISVSHDRKYISEVCDTVYRLTEKGIDKKVYL